MPKLTLVNQEGSKVGDIELSDSVFGIEPNNNVLYDVVIMQQAEKRQGTHATKNRAAVRGGGRKPWRQKGTGRARQGSIRSPQWVGGGVVFGPTPRNYSYKMPKKVRRLALKSAYSTKVKEENFIVVDTITIDTPKTKDMVAILNNLEVGKKVLIVTNEYDDTVTRSARNIPGVTVKAVTEVKVLDILGHDKLIMTKEAAEKVEEVLA
ncbi:50S ribosomal protein L4 [Pueribacillus sp. YX66]|uniref:50S ribosomal protein L4 n=1 Tax=Pueribacillus sp. YX66 TaxID=3229242 RepID=UPI00358D4C76